VIEREDSAVIRIEAVREALEAAYYRPFEGRSRVLVVNDAERLNVPAQNALLKSLEEPPRAAVFILVTSQPDVLLPTVRSRCSRLPFGRLSAAEVARVLVERHRMQPEDAHAAAAVADGSPGRALVAGTKAFRAAREAALAALRAAVDKRSWGERMQAGGALAPARGSSGGEREQLATRVRLLASLVRDVALAVNGVPAGALANGDLASEVERIAAAFDSGRAVRAYEAADHALAALARNASPKIVAPWLVTHL
jgi:DNA polymerase-3 subunit delta'